VLERRRIGGWQPGRWVVDQHGPRRRRRAVRRGGTQVSISCRARRTLAATTSQMHLAHTSVGGLRCLGPASTPAACLLQPHRLDRQTRLADDLDSRRMFRSTLRRFLSGGRTKCRVPCRSCPSALRPGVTGRSSLLVSEQILSDASETAIVPNSCPSATLWHPDGSFWRVRPRPGRMAGHFGGRLMT